MKTKTKRILLLILAILGCNSIGLIVGLFTSTSIGTWYFNLNQPSITPPNWIFAPVWTILYTLLGIILYWLWETKNTNDKIIFFKRLFYIHLGFNAMWSIIFFSLEQIQYAFFEILILLSMVLILLKMSYSFNKKIFYLLIPYALWIGFATILNFSFLMLN